MTHTCKSLFCLLSATFVVGVAACESDDSGSDGRFADSGVETIAAPTPTPVLDGAFLAKVIVESHASKYGGTASSGIGVPTIPMFSLSIHELKGQRRVLISDASSASSALLNDSQPNLVKATDKLFLGSAESVGCRGIGPVAYHRLELWVNAKGKVEGLAEGEFTIVEGDTGQAHTFKGRIETEADNVSPEIHINPSSFSSSGIMGRPETYSPLRHPFDGVGVTASEALRPLERVFLQSNDGTELNLIVTPGSETTNRSFALPWRSLKTETTYTLKFSPPATDMAGNPVRNSISFGTSSLPSYEGDDFEMERPRSIQGFRLTPSKADSLANLPAISGQTSLLMPPGPATQTRRFAMRLPLASNSKQVTLKARLVDESLSTSFYGLSIMLFTDSPKFSVYSWPQNPSPPPPRPYGAPSTLGPIMDVVLPLPEGAHGEVMLSIQVSSVLGCGLIAPLPGLIVDDIKLE